MHVGYDTTAKQRPITPSTSNQALAPCTESPDPLPRRARRSGRRNPRDGYNWPGSPLRSQRLVDSAVASLPTTVGQARPYAASWRVVSESPQRAPVQRTTVCFRATRKVRRIALLSWDQRTIGEVISQAARRGRNLSRQRRTDQLQTRAPVPSYQLTDLRGGEPPV